MKLPRIGTNATVNRITGRHFTKIIFFASGFTLAVTCAPTGSMELVFRSLQTPRKVWTSGLAPSVPRLAAELKRRNFTVCVVNRTMRESKICPGP